jgi:L-fuculose-phosphate aldolase
MTVIDEEARREVIETARAMAHAGLSPGRSGNVSRRQADGFLITPSGLDYDKLAPEDIVRIDFDGRTLEGARKPSSEWRLHAAILAARPEIGAVVHCHSLHATALACARRPIPAFHYMIAAAGGPDIRCAAYATFGTSELAAQAVAALDGRRACLLANHGQIAIGRDLAATLDLAREVETLAAQYCEVLKLGDVHILGAQEMDEVLARFATYGQDDRGRRPQVSANPPSVRRTRLP